jgi:hypothetical protein
MASRSWHQLLLQGFEHRQQSTQLPALKAARQAGAQIAQIQLAQ